MERAVAATLEWHRLGLQPRPAQEGWCVTSRAPCCMHGVGWQVLGCCGEVVPAALPSSAAHHQAADALAQVLARQLPGDV